MRAESIKKFPIMLRSVEANYLMRRIELAGTVLPTTRGFLKDYYDIPRVLVNSEHRFLKNFPD